MFRPTDLQLEKLQSNKTHFGLLIDHQKFENKHNFKVL